MKEEAMIANYFIDVKFASENLDIYNVRTSILNALKSQLSCFKGTLLDVGCGQMPYKELILSSRDSKVTKYVGLDLEVSSIHKTKVADLLWDGKIMPLTDNSVESAMATEVLEHCREPEVILKEIHRVLKPGGVFFFTVPFLWPLHEVPYDEYRYTPFCLERMLNTAGFGKTELEALGGWDASLAQMIGLWVRRRPFTDRKRKYISKIAKFIIKYLLKKDIRPQKFMESTMITGIYGVAYKM